MKRAGAIPYGLGLTGLALSDWPYVMLPLAALRSRRHSSHPRSAHPDGLPRATVRARDMRFRPTIVVLAAGRGSRYKGPRHKLAEACADAGLSILATTVRHAVESQLPLVVVTTAALAPLLAHQLATRDLLVLSDAEAARGIGHSLAAGVAERSGAPGWLMLPADMPLVRPATLLTVASALEKFPVVHAQHQGRRGYPVGFAAELYSELMLLTGDDGARRLMARYPAHGQEVGDPGVLLDVDTVADLAALRQQQAGMRVPRSDPV
jgi:molybdenum cofactor cytidylyltransferase